MGKLPNPITIDVPRNRDWRWLSVVYVLAIYVSLPFTPMMLPFGNFDLYHYIAYAILFPLLLPVFDRNPLTTLGITLSFGASEEMIQVIIPGRTFEFEDALRNFGGALIGQSVTMNFLSLKRLLVRDKNEKEVDGIPQAQADRENSGE